ncbi:MAG TPA: DoxX family protein [Rhabdochlamydiaceae bacterium]|nr:DoxX family protein [Rhabdochlamydiaceae bacterium]
MKFLVLLGRFFYSAIFIASGFGHFSHDAIHYAGMHGVPMAEFLVPFSGVIAILGGLSILLGYKARLGAWLLVIFLVPVTLMMHNFWTVHEEGLKLVQQAMFMKNLSMLGAALLIAYFGSGPCSLSGHKKK